MRFRSRLETAALLAAGLLLAACERSPPAKPATISPATHPAPVRPAARVLRLAPGVLDEVTLKGGEERAYLLDLAAGQYAGLAVDQQGIDVKARLWAPDGSIVAAVDSLNGMVGPEPLPFVAETGGRFRLEIGSSPGAPSRPLRPAARCLASSDYARPRPGEGRADAGGKHTALTGGGQTPGASGSPGARGGNPRSFPCLRPACPGGRSPVLSREILRPAGRERRGRLLLPEGAGDLRHSGGRGAGWGHTEQPRQARARQRTAQAGARLISPSAPPASQVP